MRNAKYGAAAAWRASNQSPIELLIVLKEKDPAADKDRLFSKWSEIVRGDEELLIPSLLHAFTNMHSSLERNQGQQRQVSPIQLAEKKAEFAALKEKTKETILKVALINLLELPTANGGAFGDCSKEEIAEENGWKAKVAAKLKGRQTVREVFSNDDLWKLRGK